ncbi:hypothetical protein PVAP13_5NG229681 [Panicum virgatum]|uniref:Uncharacterized protein n=1 Tax=Panicum virgatum TaxID=38727 RepID=A0A8T0RV08_PANVG|nr:hypothetical protein PVAP13_5NG229681 [Panicum virgatum]
MLISKTCFYSSIISFVLFKQDQKYQPYLGECPPQLDAFRSIHFLSQKKNQVSSPVKFHIFIFMINEVKHCIENETYPFMIEIHFCFVVLLVKKKVHSLVKQK